MNKNKQCCLVATTSVKIDKEASKRRDSVLDSLTMDWGKGGSTLIISEHEDKEMANLIKAAESGEVEVVKDGNSFVIKDV